MWVSELVCAEVEFKTWTRSMSLNSLELELHVQLVAEKIEYERQVFLTLRFVTCHLSPSIHVPGQCFWEEHLMQ